MSGATPTLEQNPLPEGWRLIEVNAEFDNLMYWMDRCERKGHLENCYDLLAPWAAFQYIEHTPAPRSVVERELLEALKKMVDVWEHGGIETYPIGEARAAIAKAEGRS